ncbi:MAG: hypothetical protein KIS66_07500 [Fimbriimonadaceae bacterium]|nr:hypothetical protein [Fimbriimonadaceae bacterium]
MINALAGTTSHYEPPNRASAETIHAAGCTCGACPACLTAKNADRPTAKAKQDAAAEWRRNEDRETGKEVALRKSLEQMTPAEREELRRLRDKDRAIRSAENFREAVAGRYVSGNVRFRYARGPDGKPYAVEAQADFDTEPVLGDPRATLRKADAIKRAALATMSPEDRAAALRAELRAEEARRDLRQGDAVRERYHREAPSLAGATLDLAA